MSKWPSAVLPYVVNRPLSLVRCPSGVGTQCFFQKHYTGKLSPALGSVSVREKEETAQYVVVRDLAGLVALVQLGVLEIHLWGAWADNPDRPDWIVFDLDPGPDVAWNRIVEAAKRLRELLAEYALKTFVKTTGGKGLHVHSPVEPKATWAEAKAFALHVARQMVAEEPGLYTTNPLKAQRQGKIFLDYLRNDRGATSIAPYSTRARPGAPVSVPLSWRELRANDLRDDHFNVGNVADWLKRLRSDPWSGFFTLRQRLPQP